MKRKSNCIIRHMQLPTCTCMEYPSHVTGIQRHKIKRKVFTLAHAFSLVELMLSLIIISLIAAAFTPVITKKLSTNKISLGSSSGSINEITNECTIFSSNCTLCIKKQCLVCDLTCSDGYYKDSKTCTCKSCPDTCNTCESDTKCTDCKTGAYYKDNKCNSYTVQNCSTYSTTEDKCETCKTGYYMSSDNICTAVTKVDNCNIYSTTDDKCSGCNDGYFLTSSSLCAKEIENCSTYDSAGACSKCNSGYDLKDGACAVNVSCSDGICSAGGLYITQYNMGDHTNTQIPSAAGVTVVSVNSTCGSSSNYNAKCCWKGNTSGIYCSTDYFDYSACNRTVCTWAAANAICSNFKYNGKTWRLPATSEMSSWGTYSQTLGSSGLMLCDFASTYPSTDYCYGSSKCTGSYGRCGPSAVWSGTTAGSSNAYYSSLNSNYGGYSNSKNGVRSFAWSVRCVADI